MIVAALEVETLGQWLTVAVVAVTAWLIYRGGGSGALATLKTANEVLGKRVDELEHENRTHVAELSALRVKTDYAAALAPVEAQLRAHDDSARKQWKEMLTVLELIAARLGPDTHGNGE